LSQQYFERFFVFEFTTEEEDRLNLYRWDKSEEERKGRRKAPVWFQFQVQGGTGGGSR